MLVDSRSRYRKLSPPSSFSARLSRQSSISRDSFVAQETELSLRGGTEQDFTRITRIELPLIIGSTNVIAIPDTGAEGNAITLDKAEELGLHVDECAGEAACFELANWKIVRSIGTTSTTRFFACPGLEKFDLCLNVFSSLAVPLLVGRAFLQATETLTRHIHRLITTIQLPPPRMHRILHLNRPQQRLRCYLRTDLVYANADTGAEMNLAAPQFAAQRGFGIEPPDLQHREVILADGSVTPLVGQFRALFDEFGERCGIARRPRPHEQIFYILEGLTTDVLLGADILTQINAFSNGNASFIDLDQLGIHSDMNLVTRLRKRQKQFHRLVHPGSSNTARAGSDSDPEDLEVAFQLELDDDDAREQHRRDVAKREIAALNGAGGDARKMTEQVLGQAYETNRMRRLQEHNHRMVALAQQTTNRRNPS
ncbi:MAG: hypothetical protein M1820_002967 [Bogoriella megaspora]|nr:MAG: hypothetical protein M1820_002967 [Bogoriella megaspora]